MTFNQCPGGQVCVHSIGVKASQKILLSIVSRGYFTPFWEYYYDDKWLNNFILCKKQDDH